MLGLESGFETADAAVISEQDILGDRLVRPRRARPPAGEFHRRGDEPLGRRPRGACRSRHRPLRRTARHRGGRRAARLPGTALRRRRQAVPAGREHRASVALRLGGDRGRPRPARRRRLAGAQGAHEEPHPRDRQRADQDRGRAADARGAQARPSSTGPTTSSAPASPTRRPTTSRRRSTPCWTSSPPAGRWTGSSAAMSASARPRWRCARPSSPR